MRGGGTPQGGSSSLAERSHAGRQRANSSPPCRPQLSADSRLPGQHASLPSRRVAAPPPCGPCTPSCRGAWCPPPSPVVTKKSIATHRRPFWQATTTEASLGTDACTSAKNCVLGFMCVPPSHQPPMPKLVACAAKADEGGECGRTSNRGALGGRNAMPARVDPCVAGIPSLQLLVCCGCSRAFPAAAPSVSPNPQRGGNLTTQHQHQPHPPASGSRQGSSRCQAQTRAPPPHSEAWPEGGGAGSRGAGGVNRGAGG